MPTIVSPKPDAEVIIPPTAINDSGDNRSSEYIAQTEKRLVQEDADYLANKYAAQAAPTAPAIPSDNPEEGPTFSAVAKDIGRGMTEIPLQTLAGLRDAAQSTIDSIYDVGDWVSSKVPALGAGIGYDPEKGIQVMNPEEFKKFQEKAGGKISPQLPEGKTPESTTGSLVHGIAQFAGGMYSAGKLLKPIQAVSAYAQGGKLLLQGAVADFTAFQASDKNLSDLIQEHPKLQNPINEYLASDPNDPKAVTRLKRSVEGMGLGVLSAGVLEGLAKGLNTIKAARAMEAEQRLVQQIAKGSVAPRALRPDELTTLGNPTGNLVETVKAPKLTSEAKGAEAILDSAKAPQTDKVYINFAKIDAPEDIQKVIKTMAESNAKDIGKAARGVRSWEDTKLSAEGVNAWDSLMKRRQGQPLNAEESVAARQLWASSAEKLTEAAKLARDVPSEANLFAFNKMLNVHNAIQKEVIAARTETARALNIWRMPTGTSKESMAQMQSILEQSGGVQVSRDKASKIAALAEAGQIGKLETFIEKSTFAKSRDAVLQTWINVNLLTNPATHSANLLSNSALLANTLLERTNAAFISKVLQQDAGVELAESFNLAKGMVGGVKDGLRASAVALKTGESKFGLLSGKVADTLEAGALSSEAWGVAKTTNFGKALDVIDTATRAPGRLLGTTDEFFKSIGYRAEVHAQASRQVSREVSEGILSKEGAAKRMQELIDNPPEDIKIAAIDAAKYNTFTNKPNEVLNNLATSLQNIPVLGRLLVPFKNTPINILTYSLERTPLAPLGKQFRMDIAEGGPKAALALSKMATGSAIMATAMDLALSGRLTGNGPEESNERALFMRSGKQPYSVKIGDQWVSYGRLDPLGLTLGYGADMAEVAMKAGEELSQEDFEQIFIASTFAVSNNVLSKTYMRSLGDFFEAINSPGTKSENWAKRISGSLVPSGVNALVKTGIPGVVEADPYMRIADDMVQNLRKRVPGLSKDLPLYRDIWGRPVMLTSEIGPAYDLFSPIYIKRDNPEPIDSELLRLEHFPSKLSRKITINHVPVELDSQEYSDYVALAGNDFKHPAFNMGAKDFMNSLVSGSHPYSQVYNQLPDDIKVKEIDKYLEQFRDGAKQELLNLSSSVKAKYEVERKTMNSRLYQGR